MIPIDSKAKALIMIQEEQEEAKAKERLLIETASTKISRIIKTRQKKELGTPELVLSPR